MERKIIITYLFVVCLGCLNQVSAQQPPVSPNGFHLGVNVEGNVAEKLSVHRIAGDLPEPKAYPTLGWKAGLEFSYHFCDYFGFSVGLDIGTTSQLAFRQYCTELYPMERFREQYFPIKAQDRKYSLQIPVKMEFSLPIRQSRWSLYGRIGINLVDVFQATYYAVRPDPDIAEAMCRMIFYGDEAHDCSFYLYDWNGYKLKVDAQLNLGVYYQLPYRDLLRFGVVANLAFQDKFSGYYKYRLHHGEYGSMTYRHNYLGVELGYIHCFKTRKERIMKKTETAE